MRAFQPNDMIKRAAAVLAMRIFYAGLALFATPILAHSDVNRRVSLNLNANDVSAINQNFQNINNEFRNTVHKTSTETIRGHKYFVDPVDFGTVTADSGTITNLNSTTGTITNIDTSSVGTNQIAYDNGTKLVGDEDFKFDGSTVTVSTVVVSTLLQVSGAATSPQVANGIYAANIVKAWAVVTNSGTPSLTDSFNISGIVDSGVGDVTLTIDRDFANATYSVNCTLPTAGTGSSARSIGWETKAVGSTHIRTHSLDSAAILVADDRNFDCVLIGDQ